MRPGARRARASSRGRRGPQWQRSASASPVLNVQSLEAPEVANVRRHEHELVNACDRRDLPIGRGRRAATSFPPSALLRVPRSRLVIVGKDGKGGARHWKGGRAGAACEAETLRGIGHHARFPGPPDTP